MPNQSANRVSRVQLLTLGGAPAEAKQVGKAGTEGTVHPDECLNHHWLTALVDAKEKDQARVDVIGRRTTAQQPVISNPRRIRRDLLKATKAES